VFHVLAGVHWRIGGGPVALGAAFGPGIGRGAGSAGYRVVTAVAWAPEEVPPPPDQDEDGVPDLDDICPDRAGWPSNDPLMNGCPPLPLDADLDSIPDEMDACPHEPGIPTGHRRTHGCPRPADRDRDGIIDREDACPKEPGPRQKDAAKNGCPLPPSPPPPPPKAELVAQEIVISEQIQFETGTAVLRTESDSILSKVAVVLGEHPEIESLEIQGHTDDTGNAPLNRQLSLARAQAVMRWLVDHGISANRLVAKGYGADQPIADNTTEEGRARNRRVQFKVFKTRPAPGAPAKEPAP
jgi:outer membrane protein OmpA-like peptidoglycan-associated protein